MQALKKTAANSASLYNGLPRSQQISLVVVVALILGAFLYLIFQGKNSAYTALSYGKVFTTEELRNAEQALYDSGKSDFYTEGRRILVPTDQVETYNAALLEGGALPTNWAEEWEKQFQQTNIFTSDNQLKTMREIALAKELRRVIQAVPGIADASVIWAKSENQSRWHRGKRKVTATVNVRPQRGREISLPVVQSLRAAVASMVADLSPEDVIIFDQSTGVSHVPNKADELFDSRVMNWIRQHTQDFQTRIASHLSYIPDVLVTVNVDINDVVSRQEHIQTVDAKNTVPVQQSQQTASMNATRQPFRGEPGQSSNTPRSLQVQAQEQRSENTEETNKNTLSAPSFTVTKQEYLPAMPKAVQVSVAIPEDFYRAIGKQRGSIGPDETDEKKILAAIEALKPTIEQDIKAQIQKLLPKDSTADAIDVKSYVKLPDTSPVVESSIIETTTHALSQWGGTLGLVLFAIFAFWMLYKSTPKMSETSPGSVEEMQLKAVSSNEDQEPVEVTSLERVQQLARDNPELAMSIISDWLEEPT